MAHALAAFIRQQMDERKLQNRDVAQASGLSRQLVSKYVKDQRDALTRLPSKETIDGLAKAFNLSSEFLLGKAIESLGLGYTSGDFVNSVASATDNELLEEIGQRLMKRRGGEGNGNVRPISTSGKPPTGAADEPVDEQVAAYDDEEHPPGEPEG